MPADGDPAAVARHLLVIACSDYPPESGKPALEVAGEIAIVDGWLADRRLGPRAFTSIAPQLRDSPSRRQIDDAFDAFAKRQVRSYDRLFVYITGHGETSDGDHYLVLTESVTPGRLASYRTSEIVRKVRDLGVQEAAIMIDTCAAAGVEDGLARLDHRLPPGFLIIAAAEEYAYVGGLTAALAAFTADGARDTLSPYLDSLELWRACGDHVSSQRVHMYPNVALNESDRRLRTLPNPHYDDAAPAGSSQQIEASFLVPDEAFTGRHRLMAGLVAAASGPVTATIVTGGAGSGKSAALRRLAAFSDPGFRAAQDRAVREVPPGELPSPGQVDIAAVATGRSSLDLVDQLSRAAGIRQAPDTSLAARADRLAKSLASRGVTTVVVDGIDEGRDPPGLVTDVLQPLAGTGQVRLILGIRLLSGVRGTAASGYPGELTLVDWAARVLQAGVIAVDAPPYWDPGDLAGYAGDLLRKAAGERGGEQPAADALGQAATRIATASGTSFLLATVLASDPAAAAGLARRDGLPDAAALLAGIITGELEATLDPGDRARAVALLRAAAISFGLGVPRRRIWPRIATAVGGGDVIYGDADVTWLLTQRVGGYLAPDIDGDVTVYRPYHAQLGDALSRLFAGGEDPAAGLSAMHGRVFDELAPMARERVIKDQAVPPDGYIARYLAEHAAAAGRLDDVLTDPRSLAAADPPRLLALLGRARSGPARDVAAVYRGTAPALAGRLSRDRASVLEAAARQQDAPRVSDGVAAAFPARPWVTRWARWNKLPEHLALADGLRGVTGLVVARPPSGTAVVVAEPGGTVRALDPETGRVRWTAQVSRPRCLSAAAGVAAVGTASEIVLLDADTGFFLEALPWPGGEVREVALSADASLLAAGNYPPTGEGPAVTWVWKRAAGGPGFAALWSAPAFTAGIFSLSWRPGRGGAELVVGGDPRDERETGVNIARIYEGATGRLIASLPGEEGMPAFSRASPSGRIVTLQRYHDLLWWKPDDSEPEHRAATEIFADINRWDVDDRAGAEAVIGVGDHGITRIEMSPGARPEVLVYDAKPRALAVARGLLITASETGTLTRWDLDQMSRSPARRVTIDRAWTSRAGSRIFSTSPTEPGKVRMEDAATGSKASSKPFDIWPVHAVTVIEERHLLLVGDASGQVHGRRSSAPGKEVFRWPIHVRGSGQNRVNSIALHEDLLITAGGDGMVRFTDCRTGQQAFPPVTDHGWSDRAMVAVTVVPDPDGETVIVAGNQAGRLLSWRLSSLRPEEWRDGINLAQPITLADRDHRDPARDMSSMAWLRQPGGMGQAAIPSGAGDIHIVDLATRAEHRWRSAHDSPVVALCEAGGLLYTADSRGLVRCWAGMTDGTPRLAGELPASLPATALLPLAEDYIAVVTAGGLAAVRCKAG